MYVYVFIGVARNAASARVIPTVQRRTPTWATCTQDLSRRRGHLHARALQIRAVLSTHIHTEQGSRPSHTDLGVF